MEIKLTKIKKDAALGCYKGRISGGVCYVGEEAFGIVGAKHAGDPLVNRRVSEVFVDVRMNDKGKKGVYISAMEHPSSAEYAEMQEICRMHGWYMPVYDKRAYQRVREIIAQSAKQACAVK